MNNKEKYLSGFLAGGIITALFHPFDVLRVRLFFAGENIGSIGTYYNGLGFNVTAACFKNLFIFPTQEGFRNYLFSKGYSEYQSEVYGSIGSGTLMSLVSTPANVIKIPLQADSQHNKVRTVAKDIYSKYGIRGFFRGQVGTGLRDITWNGLYFTIYKYLHDNYVENKMAASIIASALAMTGSYPFDGIRLYRQNNKENYNFWTGFHRSFNLSSANLKSFSMSLLRIPIATTASHMCYLYISDYLMNKKIQKL